MALATFVLVVAFSFGFGFWVGTVAGEGAAERRHYRELVRARLNG